MQQVSDAVSWPVFWYAPEGGGRNEFCIFEREFDLEAVPEAAWIEIFADTRYRLIVNGRIIGYGPPRFLPSHPVYVRHDLGGALRKGRNLLRIEVNSRGASSYQAVVSMGGLAVRGSVGTLALDLPSGWRVAVSRAWDADAEPYSFAQGPVEMRDLRVAEKDWSAPFERKERGHWGIPSAAQIPGPTLEGLRPHGLVCCATLSSKHIRRGFRGPDRAGGRQPVCFHIYSPAARSVPAFMGWGPLALNGVWLESSASGSTPNREITELHLQPGWNFCFGLPELLGACWTWQIEIPADGGLRFLALPDAEEPFLLGRPLADAIIPEDLAKYPPRTFAEVGSDFFPWHPAGDVLPLSPAKELAWDQLESDLVPPGSPVAAPICVAKDRDFTAVLDFGGEFLGHVCVEVEAPGGTVMDVGYDERLREDGTPAYFLCNPLLNSADRFILKEGVQMVETFHPRGGRYLQLTFRNVAGDVTVHRAEVRSACAAYPETGRFHSGDENIDWAWSAADRTLRASMADGWIDPWREQGLYLGDVLVQGHATRKITSDWRLDPWCLRLWAQAQFSDGQLPDVVPSSHDLPLIDYTLIWIIALRNYWAESGDLALVEDLWPTLAGIFASPAWSVSSLGLWEVRPGQRIFIDWGATPEECSGVNACLNAFRYHALVCAAEMADATGRHDSAMQFQKDSADVKQAYRQSFWNEDSGRFHASVLHGVPHEGPALHANALALAFGLDMGDARTADYLAEHLRVDASFPAGRIEMYFLYYALIALQRSGRIAAAEQAIRSYYGFMRRRGAWTLWERLMQGAKGRDSMCHGWSSGAVPFLAEYTLGVRPEVPGDPRVMIIAPESATLDGASGRVAHPSGPIEVAWVVSEGRLSVDVHHPEEIQVVVRPKGRLAEYPLAISLRTHGSSAGARSGDPVLPRSRVPEVQARKISRDMVV